MKIFVENCARCGINHEVEFTKFKSSCSIWGICENTSEPILIEYDVLDKKDGILEYISELEAALKIIHNWAWVEFYSKNPDSDHKNFILKSTINKAAKALKRDDLLIS